MTDLVLDVEPTILAIETSAEALSVALCVGSKIVARHLHVPRGQSKLVVPTIADVFEEAGIAVTDLDAIAFGRGPGSFTGIRVATSVAQGIGLAAEIPLLPISSLACLAQGVITRGNAKQVLVCLDARLGEVYWGLFAAHEGLAVLQGEERVDLPTAVIEPQHGFAIIGSAMTIKDEHLDKIRSAAQFRDPALDPDALDLLTLAADAWLRRQAVAADRAAPVYLRNKVVSS
jgi:tRNA threonylcarbamoyladenosine biosynthesis protein TsaB